MESVILALVAGAASFVGSWAALQVNLKWMRFEIRRAHERLDRLEYPHFAPHGTRGKS